MCSVRKSKPAPADAQTSRVVFVNRSQHQLQHRRYVYFSSVGACTSSSTDGTFGVPQSESAPAAVHTARLVFVIRSLHQLQYKRHV